MRKFFLFLMLGVAYMSFGQRIKSGSSWNLDNLDYIAKVNADNTITFTATAEGEELAFRLTPNVTEDGDASKKNEYVLGDDPNADGFNPFSDSPRVKYIERQGWKLLCLYDLEGRLHNVFDGTQTTDGEKVTMSKWMQQIMGKYVTANGDNVDIAWERMTVGNVVCSYNNIQFNGTVTGVVNIVGPSRLAGMWEVVQTLDGLTLYGVEQDEYGLFNRKGYKETLSWVNTEPRFGYANRVLLNDRRFRLLKKSTLRIMRNSILARHGYMVSSPDLVEYFGSQPWFVPRPTNDGVIDELTLVEQLNIELIKAEEAKPDKDRYVKE